MEILKYWRLKKVMKKIFEVYVIKNGFLVKDKDGEYKSFQVDDRNPQSQAMIEYFVKLTGEKRLKVVDESVYIKVLLHGKKTKEIIRVGPNDGSSSTKPSGF